MTLPEFLTQHPDGEIRLTGHRIGLYHLVHYYDEGYSPEMLVGRYPTLPLALVHKIFAFFLENQDEVTAYVNSCAAELAKQRQENARRLDVAGLRARLEARQRAESIRTATGT
jgi:uncharacterized protein (DUF433 family)